jgi:hypothetical protein
MKTRFNSNSQVLTHFITGACLAIFVATASAQSKNARLTATAFLAFEDSNFQVAISNAQECIDQYDVQATAFQDNFARTNAVMPPVGTVNTNLAQTINANGVLNDVASCYFIVGECNRKLALQDKTKIADAKEAYEKARYFTYGRCWDTNGFFWSQADAANARLKKLPPASR